MATRMRRGRSWRIQFYVHGKRRTYEFRGSEDDADTFQRNLESLIAHRKRGVTPPAVVRAWVESLDGKTQDKLRRYDLIEASLCRVNLQRLIDVKSSHDSHLAKSTCKVRKWVYDAMKRGFGSDRSVLTISPSDAEQFKCDMLRVCEPSSVRNAIVIARQLFNTAVDNGWIVSNPFSKVKPPKSGNVGKCYISPDEFTLALDAVSDPQAKLLMSLARWGGLRIPSEAEHLRWSMVDWDRGRLTIYAPKTKSERVCPLFPELAAALDVAWRQHTSPWVIPKLKQRGHGHWARYSIITDLEAAGIAPWPHLFLALRRSRATEVADRWGLKAETEWIGHGAAVSLRHYQMVLDSKFDEASRTWSTSTPSRENRVATAASTIGV